jgi:hypothetical protein
VMMMLLLLQGNAGLGVVAVDVLCRCSRADGMMLRSELDAVGGRSRWKRQEEHGPRGSHASKASKAVGASLMCSCGGHEIEKRFCLTASGIVEGGGFGE